MTNSETIQEFKASRNKKIRPDIVLKYPPDYDGELHIQFDCLQNGAVKFTFIGAGKPHEPPHVLLRRLAKDIANKLNV